MRTKVKSRGDVQAVILKDANNAFVGSVDLWPIPNTPFVWSDGMHIVEHRQGEGLSYLLSAASVEWCQENSKTRLVCYIQDDNACMVHRLTKLGWDDLGDGIWMRHVT